MFISRCVSIKSLILFIVVLCPFLLQAQIRGRIVEKDTKLPIAFASVFYQDEFSQKGFISDVHGAFEIKESAVSSFTVSCMGYRENTICISSQMDTDNIVVELEVLVHELNEVTITPANNPAIPIIKSVLRNKANNNFEKYDTFSYQCYFKTLMDVKLSDDATSQDSVKVNDDFQFKERAPFISESVFSCLQLNNRTEKKIIAQNTSGFEDPLFAQSFVTAFHNSISFYNNSISLFNLSFGDKSISEYVSPLSDGCLSCYNFQLEDTHVNVTDSIFVISFYPKKGRKFNGLKGQLYISSNGYAIKNIVAEPFEKCLIGFKFRQDYEFIDNKWFPTNLDEEIGWTSHKLGDDVNAYLAYVITSKIDSIDFNPDVSDRRVSLEKVYLDKYSMIKSDSILNVVRPDSLSLRERNSYRYMDSLGQRYNLDYWLKLFPKLAVGKIPVGHFDVDLLRLYTYNKYEGSRLGVGLSTNEKLSDYVSVGGFVGYGLKDKEYKYGGHVAFDINKYNEVRLKLSYQDNLKEVGMDVDNGEVLSSSDYLRSYMGDRFDNCIERKLEFSFRSLRFLKFTTSLSLKELTPMYSYTYKGSGLASYENDEVELSVRYAVGEELSTMGSQRVVSVEGNPVINLTYKRGIDIFNKRSFTYNKVEATIDYTAYSGRIGQSKLRLAAGLIDQSLPYGLLFTGEGSRNECLSFVVNNSFQTMSPYEFLSDKYVSLFYSHNFGSLLFASKNFKPQFVVVQNSGWGSLDNAFNHGIDFKVKDKIYLESGLVVNNVVKLNYLNMFYFGFAVGGFYRYGYYKNDSFNDNFALKCSITMSLR